MSANVSLNRALEILSKSVDRAIKLLASTHDVESSLQLLNSSYTQAGDYRDIIETRLGQTNLNSHNSQEEANFPQIDQQAGTPANNTDGEDVGAIRRPHDYGFDLALLTALSTAKESRPIGLHHLHKIASLYDASGKPASITAKLHRWRKDRLVSWRESDRRTLTEAGHKKLADITSYVDGSRRDRIKVAIKKVLNVNVDF